MKKIVLACLLSISTLSLVACTPSEEDCEQMEEQMNTSFIGPYSDDEIDKLNKIKEIYAEHCTSPSDDPAMDEYNKMLRGY